jgi:hypothetical protein
MVALRGCRAKGHNDDIAPIIDFHGRLSILIAHALAAETGYFESPAIGGQDSPTPLPRLRCCLWLPSVHPGSNSKTVRNDPAVFHRTRRRPVLCQLQALMPKHPVCIAGTDVR